MTQSLQASDVAVLVLNYQGCVDTIACLQSLAVLNSPPRSVIVVDNNSSDGSVERILNAWRVFASPVTLAPDAVAASAERLAPSILLTLPDNDGYSAGNNAGMRVAFSDPGCKAVWVLNNDTEPQPQALDALCARLNAVPGAGIAGSTMVYAHDRNLVQCAGGGGFNRWLGTTSASHGKASIETVLRLDPATVEAELDDIIGASMLIRQELVERIGTFEEKFFLYTEETEFCVRAAKAGFSFAWAPQSIVYHKEGATTGAQTAVGARAFIRPLWVDYLGMRNRIWLIRRHYPLRLPVACLGYLGVMLNRIRRKQANRTLLVMRAVWDGLHGRMGRPPSDLW